MIMLIYQYLIKKIGVWGEFLLNIYPPYKRGGNLGIRGETNKRGGIFKTNPPFHPNRHKAQNIKRIAWVESWVDVGLIRWIHP